MSSTLHDFLETFHLDLLNALIRPLLCIYAIKKLLLGQNVQYGADSLEHDRLIILKEVWEAPRLERVVAPNQQVWALVDLGHCHRTAALNVEVVDVKTKVVD